jgi:hypothetical protein
MSKRVEVKTVVSVEQREQLREMAKAVGLPQNELVRRAVEQMLIEGVVPGANARDKEIKQAAGLLGLSYDQFRDMAARQEAATLIGNAKRVEAGETVRGSAALRLNSAIDAIMQHNDACENLWEKHAIVATLLANKDHPFGVGSNRPAIKRVLAARADEIEAHHQKHGIGPNHNSTAYQQRKELGLL